MEKFKKRRQIGRKIGIEKRTSFVLFNVDLSTEQQLSLFSEEELGEEREFDLKRRRSKAPRKKFNPKQTSFRFLEKKETLVAPKIS